MSKFHLNKVLREANKAKKAMVNRIKHNIVYGKVYSEIETNVALNMLANIGEPSFRHMKYVIRLIKSGEFLRDESSDNPYVADWKEANIFDDFEEAEAVCASEEEVVAILPDGKLLPVK